MKKIVLILLVLVSVGCSLYDSIYSEIADDTYEREIQKANIFYHEDFYTLHSISDIQEYLNKNMEYKSDGGDGDVWSTAKEIFTRGYGDCEDYAILFINIYYVVFGVKLSVVAIASYREVVAGGEAGHLLVELSTNILISPRSGRIDRSSPVLYRYSFDLFFY